MSLWLLLAVPASLLALYLLTPRRYDSGDSVASAYDSWTEDGILEFYWGEHIHLGYYGNPPRQRDFREAKHEFTRQMARWGGLTDLPAGSTLLDVGCGIGGSSRILAREFGFDVTGITISPGQVERARQLTEAGLSCRFQVDDAMRLSFPDASFDVVWCIEAGPHMPDKPGFARELLRVLKPGGRLVVADWNQRDARRQPLRGWERVVMRQLLDQWAHPEFASIEGFAEDLEATGLVAGQVTTADLTRETLPSWLESIWEGVKRPSGIFRFGPRGFVKMVREIPTIVLMRLAFGAGLCRFGMFRAVRAAVPVAAGPR